MTRLFSIALFAALALAAPEPARAEWRAANPAVEKASGDPQIAEVLKAVTAIDAAILAGDKARFIGAFAADAVVNSPGNNVVTRAMIERRFGEGALAYKYLRRSIEHAARRGSNDVVLMGEETYEFTEGAPQAGRVLKRRFTDIWTREPGGWRLSLRQATIIGEPVVGRP